MASTTPTMLRVSVPLARAAVAAARRPDVRGLAASAARRLGAGTAAAAAPRHPMMPAGLRIERSRTMRRGRSSKQTAVTMWFGQGPALPGPTAGTTVRSALRLGGGVVGAAALAAMTVIAARREEQRGTIVEAAPPLTIS